MQSSSTKKRRLAALQHYHGAGTTGGNSDTSASAGATEGRPAAAAVKQQGQQPAQRRTGTSRHAVAVAAAAPAAQQQPVPAGAAPSLAAGISRGTPVPSDQQHVVDTSSFPYAPLPSSTVRSHLASRLLLGAPSPLGRGGTPASATAAAAAVAPATTTSSGLEDVLEGLMVPHMPPPTARSMIASRLPADKVFILSNPPGRVNLTRPSAAARGRRQQLAGALLPRARRAALATLPRSGNDHSAMLALHELWAGYAAGVLRGRRGDALLAVLQSLDWHGALLRVAHSSNPLHAHRAGVVAKVTANTLVLVSAEGRASTVPIRGSRFEGSIHCGADVHEVTIAGDSARALKVTVASGASGGT